MNELASHLIWAAAVLAVVTVICLAGLKAWRGWLELKRDQMAAGRAESFEPAARIEMADVKERLRKLEAIARGVDL